ncbi:hypothetical protein SteCoe_8154 [Stentor coeruleus]|uniref:Importin subunit alpha n=1 Tax=Stentor coeruleus TaxID=5963 RepID=A0A1R2CKS6_9CILI|nr:hypothetical protein SteCoe_8154 [Stentor coeruleus]
METFNKRQKNFQKFDTEKNSEKRHKFAIDLRKSKRKAHIEKMRDKFTPSTNKYPIDAYMGPTDSSEELDNDFEEMELDTHEMIEALKNPYIQNHQEMLERLNAHIMQYPILREEQSISELINLIIPFTSPNTNIELRSVVYCIICNIASGSSTSTDMLLQAQVIPLVFKELENQQKDLYENLFWILGNLMSENQEIFFEIINKNFFQIALRCVTEDLNLPSLQIIGWTLKNAAHYENLLQDKDIDDILEISGKLLNSPYNLVKTEIIQCLAVVARNDEKKILKIIETKLLHKCLDMWEIDDLRLDILKLSANISCGSDDFLQVLIELNILDLLDQVLISNKKNEEIVQAFFILCNIAAGNPNQILILIKHPIFLKSLNGILSNEEQIQKEAAYYIFNLTITCKKETLEYLFSIHYLKKISQALEHIILSECILHLLNAYEKICSIADIENLYKEGCYMILDRLQTHNNPEVYSKCVNILENYYEIFEN